MADEYFYGVTLKGANASIVWDPETRAEEYPRTNKLVIKIALLGLEAKKDEYNVVQVETMSMRDTIKIPICALKEGPGEQRQVSLDLEFPDSPVTFSLVSGEGPVHLVGQHLLGAVVEEFEDMDDMEEEMLDEEEGDEPHDDEEDDEEGPKGKKAKLSNNTKGKSPAQGPKKNAKK